MNEELLGRLVAELKLRGRANGTISAYKTEVVRFFHWYTRPLVDLTIQDVKDYQLYLISSGFKFRTVNVRMGAVRFFLSLCVGERLVSEVYTSDESVKDHNSKAFTP